MHQLIAIGVFLASFDTYFEHQDGYNSLQMLKIGVKRDKQLAWALLLQWFKQYLWSF